MVDKLEVVCGNAIKEIGTLARTEQLVFGNRIVGLECLDRISLYYIVYFFTNTLGHANIEFRKLGYCAAFLGRVINSPSYHVLHHARYLNNYGLLPPWLDQLFGTAWVDFGSVQTRAATSKPFMSLSERVDP